MQNVFLCEQREMCAASALFTYSYARTYVCYLNRQLKVTKQKRKTTNERDLSVCLSVCSLRVFSMIHTEMLPLHLRILLLATTELLCLRTSGHLSRSSGRVFQEEESSSQQQCLPCSCWNRTVSCLQAHLDRIPDLVLFSTSSSESSNSKEVV